MNVNRTRSLINIAARVTLHGSVKLRIPFYSIYQSFSYPIVWFCLSFQLIVAITRMHKKIENDF